MASTKGPWKVVKRWADLWRIEAEDGALVARTGTEANARLIAAAPEMKNMLRGLVINWDCDTGANGKHSEHCRSCAAEALLAKIDGREP